MYILKIRSITSMLLAAISLTFLAGCATTPLPAPKSPTDTLLVLRVKTESDVTFASSPIGYYKISFKRDDKEHWYTIRTDRPFTYIHGLSPGTYRATKLTATSPYTKWDINFGVKVTSGQLRIAPFEVVVTLFRDKKTGNIYQRISFQEINFKERVDIARELQEKDNGALWDIDYSE
jgi:hypothetical protein